MSSPPKDPGPTACFYYARIMTQDFSSLNQLLHQSQQLAAKVSSNRNVPILYRGLEQIEAFTSKLHAKTVMSSSDSNDARNHDLSKISFVPASQDALTFVRSTDLAGYLQSEYERKIISSVESIQKETNKKISDMISAKLSDEWERRKKAIMEETGSFGAFTEGSAAAEKSKTASNQFSGPKFMSYVSVIKKLNSARLKGSRFPIAKTFSAELSQLDGSSRPDQVISCWDCLAFIENEDELENVFLDNNASVHYRSSGASGRLQWSKTLISGSKKYLESSFSKFVDSTIALYPRDAVLGGRPSNIDRVKAFLSIRLKRSSPSDMQKLEMIDGIPIWTCIFYLFRCGFLREAYQLASQYDYHLLKSEPGFISYLKAFIETEDNFLTGTIRAQIQSDYSQRLIVGQQDPYKLALLKILGRCDLSKKTIPDIISTTQDYIWLQLWLVKEGMETSSSFSSSSTLTVYNLSSLQKLVLDLGPAYFNPKGNAPLQYFEILLTVGLFEDAIGYLFETNHQLDAIHVAIALLYHGTLNLTPNPDSNNWESVVSMKDPSGQALRCLNVFKLVSIVAKSFSSNDVIDALQYYLLLPLGAVVSIRYNTICQESIRDTVLATGNFSAILGDLAADGVFRPGLLANFAPLMNLSDERVFVESITKSAASKCEKENKYRDAIHLYNLAGDYDKVLQILNRKLSQEFSQAYVPDSHASLYNIGLAVVNFYTQNQLVALKVGRSGLEASQSLLGLMEFKRLTAESRWSQALQKVDELKIIPDGDASAMDEVVERFKSVDDSISANLSEILLMSMTSIYQLFLQAREHAAQDVGRQMEIQRLRRKSRAIMIFVGFMQYRVSQEVCSKLTRMDIFIN